jgi:hypothetical protein
VVQPFLKKKFEIISISSKFQHITYQINSKFGRNGSVCSSGNGFLSSMSEFSVRQLDKNDKSLILLWLKSKILVIVAKRSIIDFGTSLKFS